MGLFKKMISKLLPTQNNKNSGDLDEKESEFLTLTIGDADYRDDELKEVFATKESNREVDVKKVYTAELYDRVTGEVICSLDNLTTHDFEYYPSDNRLTKFSGFGSATFTLTDASFNTEALRELMKTSSEAVYTLTGVNERLNRLKYIAKRTKNKRIRNKVTKQIRRIDHPIYNEGMKLKASNMTFETVRNYRDLTK